MEDKIVEIARFYEPVKARLLESLLKSEGVPCYLRNEYTSQVMYPVQMGGVRVELPESEVPHAMEVMAANGYEFPEEDEFPEAIQTVSGWTRYIPFLRRWPLERQILTLFIVIAVLLALLIYLGSLVTSS